MTDSHVDDRTGYDEHDAAYLEETSEHGRSEVERVRELEAERDEARSDAERSQRNLAAAHAALCGASDALRSGDAHEAYGWLTRREAYDKALAWKRQIERERDEARAEVDRLRAEVERWRSAWWELAQQRRGMRATLKKETD